MKEKLKAKTIVLECYKYGGKCIYLLKDFGIEADHLKENKTRNKSSTQRLSEGRYIKDG